MFSKIGNYFVQSFEELKKVSWPSKKVIINFSIIVLVSIIVAMLFLAGIDWLLSKLITVIIGG
jgi:preprotein translocase subunit SecE